MSFKVVTGGLPHIEEGGAPTFRRAGLPEFFGKRLGVTDTEVEAVGRSLGTGVEVAEGWRLCGGSVRGAGNLGTKVLREQVWDLYRAVMGCGGGGHLVRMWNFIAGIHDARGEGMNTYRVFNQARREAFTACGVPGSKGEIPTATGVGWDGEDVVVLALFAPQPGEAVENPRQVRAYEYSSRHGPTPPCFARATRVQIGEEKRLLIGGTSSVVGEDSVHAGDVEGQARETLKNLKALLRADAGERADGAEVLRRLTHVRTYVARNEDMGVVSGMVGAALPWAERELVRASICREELLVEVEGVAEVGD